MEKMTFDAFAGRYCDRQDNTPDGLKAVLNAQKKKFQPVGWILLECQDMSGSRMRELTIFPYGPNNTLKEVPANPISPRGLASDMSTVVGVLAADDLPE